MIGAANPVLGNPVNAISRTRIIVALCAIVKRGGIVHHMKL